MAPSFQGSLPPSHRPTEPSDGPAVARRNGPPTGGHMLARWAAEVVCSFCCASQAPISVVGVYGDGRSKLYYRGTGDGAAWRQARGAVGAGQECWRRAGVQVDRSLLCSGCKAPNVSSTAGLSKHIFIPHALTAQPRIRPGLRPAPFLSRESSCFISRASSSPDIFLGRLRCTYLLCLSHGLVVACL